MLLATALPALTQGPPQSADCDRVRQKSGRVLVAAAASLQPALQETTALYRSAFPRQEVSSSFAASGVLARQIEQGAPVDLFLAAAEGPMDRLQRQGLLEPGSRRSLLTNQLVLITPRSAPATIRRFADLTQASVRRIAIGEPLTVPAGDYARQTLRSLRLWERLQPKLLPLANVRAVLTAVELGNAEAGLVYRTDAQGSERVQTVAIASPHLHTPIRYPLAVLRRSPDPQAARCYANFLQSPAAQTVFRRFGFGLVPVPSR